MQARSFMAFGQQLKIIEEQYRNKRIALQIYDEEGPYCTLTTNIVGETLQPGEFFIKNWSENEEIAAAALNSGIFEDTGRRVNSGFIEVPVWRFKAE